MLLNGVPGKVFHCKTGVRQGDPFSPLLYVLASDCLQRMVNDARDQNLLQLPIPLQHSQDFPILQYADDTLVIMEACFSQILALKNLLQEFSNSTWLMVYYSKSMLVPVNVEENRTSLLAQLFGCVVGSLPFTYLGLPLGLTKPKVNDFLPLVIKCERRLAFTSSFFYLKLEGWKSQTPSSHHFPCSSWALSDCTKWLSNKLTATESTVFWEVPTSMIKRHQKLHGNWFVCQ